ncbi:YafY family transcriptional regulator [Actinomadura sp. KC345]|uniref:helix-turn-helix transcriptional regulator n=1 Tax=Actinomadura sp. KC345 TaxID=2530371 RepID=UPI0010467B49|nr:YafY family protein [Actinomadura sp. KC345]TDC55518.1 YafY family transcriptional regulator [Actinomadura sp. KC345]
MNRTDRLYALVEELRACAPRRVSARELAARYEVSVRTIERDICALQQAGVPIYADVGRGGGYTLDKSRTLPPLNFTPAEAVAVAITLARAGGAPYSRSARTALHKIVSAMSGTDSDSARELAGRVRILTPPEADDRDGRERAGARGGSSAHGERDERERPGGSGEPSPHRQSASVPAVLEEAMSARRVVRLGYVDASGSETERDVEPVGFTALSLRWYLLGWCRLRGEARVFRIDRVRRAALLDEPAPERDFDDLAAAPADYVARPLEFV